jgi:hypothetical protein
MSLEKGEVAEYDLETGASAVSANKDRDRTEQAGTSQGQRGSEPAFLIRRGMLNDRGQLALKSMTYEELEQWCISVGPPLSLLFNPELKAIITSYPYLHRGFHDQGCMLCRQISLLISNQHHALLCCRRAASEG